MELYFSWAFQDKLGESQYIQYTHSGPLAFVTRQTWKLHPSSQFDRFIFEVTANALANIIT